MGEMVHFRSYAAIFIFLGLSVFGIQLFSGCGKGRKACAPALHAELVEDSGSVQMALRNISTCEFSICTDNVYDDAASLDVRRFPDTAEIPAEKVFGASPAPQKRGIITVSDFVSILPGQEIRVPLNMRCILDGCKLGDTVFVRAYFKNIDPLACSKVEVGKFDKATQDYGKRIHFVPNSTLTYWAGEVRTPYRALRLCTYAPPRPKVRKASPERIVRRSRTHPLTHKVF